MKKLLFFLCALTIAPACFGQPLKIATYNIRQLNEGDDSRGNGWTNRCPVIISMIEFNDFDILGTQEGFYSQLKDMEGGLADYVRIGVGRDDGKQEGEHSAIFYKKDRFDILDKGDFWLSTDTSRPNKGWDAALPRICSWGKFRDKVSGAEFVVFNLHMDHVGVEARRQSCKLILEKTSKLISEGTEVILMGDFNVDQKNEIYGIIADSGILRDSYYIADKRYATNGTFNNFNPSSFTDGRIDHIFLSPHFKVKRYGVLTDSYRSAKGEARVPSDHFPVVVITEIGAKD